MFRLILWSLFKRARLRERTEKANRWAESHKRQTAMMTVGSLFLLLVVGTAMTFLGGEGKEDNILEGIMPVNPMFQGLQRIQDGKAYQAAWLDRLALDGQRLKRQLDSLIRIPDKTHDDSLQIVIKHRQLEIIVDNLENR